MTPFYNSYEGIIVWMWIYTEYSNVIFFWDFCSFELKLAVIKYAYGKSAKATVLKPVSRFF